MKAHYIGIDVSKLTLDIHIYNMDINNYLQITNNESGFKALLKWFKSKKIILNEIAVCLEHTGIYSLNLCDFLYENSIDYIIESPLRIKRSLGITRGKSDVIDAARIARYCYLYREELKYSQPKSKILIRVRELMVERRGYVKRASQCKSYITECKKKPLDSTQSRCIEELSIINGFLASVEKELIELVKSDVELYKNYQLITSIVGISLVNAVNILLYTENFTSFPNARAYACYTGIAPFSSQSGTSLNSNAAVSPMANRMLKTDLSQAALSAITHDPQMRQYYARKKAEGKATGVVLNAVKFKLIERIFAVVKRGTPYVKLGNHSL